MDKPSYLAKKLILILLRPARCINRVRNADEWQLSKDQDVEQYLYRYAKEMDAVLFRTENDLYFLPKKNLCIYGKKNLDIIKDLKNVSLNDAYLADLITQRLVTMMFKAEIVDDQRQIVQYRAFVTVSELCKECQRVFEKISDPEAEFSDDQTNNDARLAGLWMDKAANKVGIENEAVEFVRNSIVSYWTANNMFHLTDGKIYPTKITRDIMARIFAINENAWNVFLRFRGRE